MTEKVGMERNMYKLCEDGRSGRRQSNSQIHPQRERIWEFERRIPLEIHFSEKLLKNWKFEGLPGR